MFSEEPLLQNFGLNSSNSSPKKLPVESPPKKKNTPISHPPALKKGPKYSQNFHFQVKFSLSITTIPTQC